MSPLSIVGIICALVIPHINCNFPHPQPDISLNTISSTPFPSVKGSYAQSGSAGYGAVSGFLVNPGQALGSNGKVWFLDSNSPFKIAPLKSCNICAAGGSAAANHNHYEASAASPSLRLDMSHNPFLTGQVPQVPADQIPHVTAQKVEASSVSQVASGSSIDISKNPFLTGQVPIPTCTGQACNGQVQSGGCTGNGCNIPAPTPVSGGCSSGSCTGSSQTIQLGGNPFLSGGSNTGVPSKPLDTGYKFPGQIPLPPKPLDTGYNFPGFNIPEPPKPNVRLPGFATSLPQKPQGFATSLPTNLNRQAQQFEEAQQQQQQFEQSQQQFEQSQIAQQQFEQSQIAQQQFEQGQQQIVQSQQQTEQSQQQEQQGGFINVAVDKDDEDLTVACAKTNHICVPTNECINGKVITSGQGIIQARTSIDYCKVSSEVCCEINQPAILNQKPAESQGSEYQLNTQFQNQGTKIYTTDSKVFAQNPLFGPSIAGSYSSNGIVHVEPNTKNILFSGSKQGPQYLPPYPTPVSPTPEPELIPPYSPDGSNSNSVTAIYPTTPKVVTTGYLPPQPTTTPKTNNGYLPPLVGDGSNIDNQKVPLPSNGFGTFLPRPTPPKPITDFDALPSGCPAALICVEEDFCTADGVASQSRVYLTESQKESRVPITSCTIAGGKPGKCCRDPTYKDPWPVGQLGLWNPNDGFDDGSYKGSNSNQGRVSLPRPTPPPPRPQTNVRPIDNDLAASGQCAIRDRNTRPRGRIPLDANFAEIPWQAMILRDTNKSLLCGGVIISDNAVLTAAHCVAGYPTNDILVKGGEWRLGVDEEPKPFQIVKVGAIVIHPRYDQQRQLNDLALLFLVEKFRFDQHIQPICILEDEEVERSYPNADCITSGWGKDVLRIHIQNALMHQMDINFIQKGDCQAQLQQRYPASLYRYEPSSCLCAQPKVPEYTICDVDQGSALACDIGNGVYLLAGVLSWDTEGCTNSTNEIAAFARLDTKWIYEFLAKPIEQIIAEYGSSSNIQSTFIPVKGGVKGGVGGVKGGSRLPAFPQNPYFGNFGSFSHNVPVIESAPSHHVHADGQPCDCKQQGA